MILDQTSQSIWREFDTKKVGALDKISAFKFVEKVLKPYGTNLTKDFDKWFDEQDTQKTQYLEKETILKFIK
jgi:uncharacterized protein YlbG (UPF0298 family)